MNSGIYLVRFCRVRDWIAAEIFRFGAHRSECMRETVVEDSQSKENAFGYSYARLSHIFGTMSVSIVAQR